MMKMEITFDQEALEREGYTRESVAECIRGEVEQRGLVWLTDGVADGEVLSFGTSGHKDDYSRMLIMMKLLEESEWFVSLVTSWLWIEPHGCEDILRQIKDEQKIGHRNTKKVGAVA